jgi:hypothetical protein
MVWNLDFPRAYRPHTIKKTAWHTPVLSLLSTPAQQHQGFALDITSDQVQIDHLLNTD